MKVYLAARAQKAYDKTNEPDKSRLNKALFGLGEEPPQGDIKKLQGRNEYSLHLGGRRILFDIYPDYVNPATGDKGAVIVSKIETRGGVYKGA